MDKKDIFVIVVTAILVIGVGSFFYLGGDSNSDTIFIVDDEGNVESISDENPLVGEAASIFHPRMASQSCEASCRTLCAKYGGRVCLCDGQTIPC